MASASTPAARSRSRLTLWFLALVALSVTSLGVIAVRFAALPEARARQQQQQQQQRQQSEDLRVHRDEAAERHALIANATNEASEFEEIVPTAENERAIKTRASDMSSSIPRVIHQSWKTRERIPSRFAPWMRSWTRHHPAWTYVFWTDADNLALFEHLYPQYLAAARGVSKISLADMARYALLHRIGGLYVDADFECTRPFDALHEVHELFLASEPLAHAVLLEKSTEPALCNAIMASRPGHPFWLSVLDAIQRKFEQQHRPRPNAFDAVGLTGPRIVKQTYFGSASYHNDPALAVLTPEYFYPEVAYWNLGEMEKACSRNGRLGRTQGGLKEASERACRWLKDFPSGEFTEHTHATHHWQCTWCRGEQSTEYRSLGDIFAPNGSLAVGSARVARPAFTDTGVELVDISWHE